MDRDAIKTLLETEFIDKYGFTTIQSMLYDICHEKANYIESKPWQDTRQAKVWKDYAKILGHLLND